MKWAGHIRRMNDQRIPKKLLFGEIVEGKAQRSKPKKTWMNCLSEDCASKNVTNWIALSKDRQNWKRVIYGRPEPLEKGGART